MAQTLAVASDRDCGPGLFDDATHNLLIALDQARSYDWSEYLTFVDCAREQLGAPMLDDEAMEAAVAELDDYLQLYDYDTDAHKFKEEMRDAARILISHGL